ncbi:MAG: hypothetical protein IH609_05805 [Dehalococcoidia bacterium]|nr:hypothetical protein [Dehalococcoidia bacterium]
MPIGSHRQRRAHAPSRGPAAKANPVGAKPGPVRTPLASLQSAAGNQALQRSLASPAGATVTGTSTRNVARPPSIRRLISTEDFKKQTNAGLLAGRGKTMKQIDALLSEYHALRAKGMHLQPGSTQDRAINILHELRENVNLWMDTHEGDKSRSKKRTPGMTALFLEAGKELAELTKIRDASREFLGEDQKPVERTENKFKTQMEGDVSSILSKIGPIIGAAAPSSGDSAELEIEVKVPVEPSGVGYIGFRFKASVERLKKEALKVGFEVAVTGGANIPNVVEIGGELGMYVEAQGSTPQKAMELVSYGMYRRIRESRAIPNEVANVIWGGSSSAVGWKRAEKWAARVEKENFKDKSLNLGGTGDSDEEDAYVETGGLAGAKAKGGIGGVVDLEGSVGYKSGKKYDYESVKARKSAGLGKASALPKMRGLTEVLGESTHHLEFALSATGGPFSGGIKVGLDWASGGKGQRATLQSLTVSLDASASIPMNELVAKGVGGYIPPLASNLAIAIRKAIQNAANEKSTTSQDVGTLISAGENGASSILQIAQVPQTAWVPKFEAGAPPDTFSAPAALKLTLTGGYDFSKKEFKFEAKLEYIKGIEVNVGVFAMKVKQGQKLVRVFYDGGKWGVD